MASCRKCFLIYNPKSGAVKNFPLDDYVEILVDNGFEVSPHQVDSHTHMDEIVTEAIDTKADLLVIAGGDGTLQSLLCCLNGVDIPVLPIPIGTENLFARQMGIIYDINQFRYIITSNKVRKVDLLRFNDTLATSVAGVGFDAEVIRYMDMRRTSNIQKIHYFVPVVKAILGYKFPQIKVVADGKELCNQCAMVFIGNISYYGGGLRIFPEADCTDGRMNVVIYKCSNKLQLLYLFTLTFLRLHKKTKLIQRTLCKSLQITSEVSDVSSQIDGEPGPKLPLKVDILPEAVEILVF